MYMSVTDKGGGDIGCDMGRWGAVVAVPHRFFRVKRILGSTLFAGGLVSDHD